jgi:3-hydroxyisobutyrate dehydrogenase
MMKTGFIGLGAMGANMARNIAKQGFLNSLWNRTPARAIALSRELGVPRTSSPALLASQVDLILLCVSADQDVLEIIQAILPNLRPDSIVVDLSTVSSDTARTVAQLVRNRGGDFLDAPVSGGVEGARHGTLAIMVGGNEETLKRALPVLNTLGSRIIHMGEVGMGQAAKAVNQVMAAGINEAVTEALAFGERLGLNMPKLIDVVSGGAAGNWFLEKRGLSMTQGTFKPGFKLALHHKDLKICQAMANNLGSHLPMVEMALENYSNLMAQGYGDEDISTLYRRKKPTEL